MSDDPAADRQQALQTALAKMDSFKACEALIRQQAELLKHSVELHQRSMQFFNDDYLTAMQSLDQGSVEQLRRFNDDVLAFMEQARSGTMATVQELQAIVAQITHEIRDAAGQSS